MIVLYWKKWSSAGLFATKACFLSAQWRKSIFDIIIQSQGVLLTTAHVVVADDDGVGADTASKQRCSLVI
jgi:hypothetical protein